MSGTRGKGCFEPAAEAAGDCRCREGEVAVRAFFLLLTPTPKAENVVLIA